MLTIAVTFTGYRLFFRHDGVDMALVNYIIGLQKHPVKLLLQLMNLTDDFVHIVLSTIYNVQLFTVCCLKNILKYKLKIAPILLLTDLIGIIITVT